MIGDSSLISLADLKHKEKEQRGRFGEIDEKISREEYTLDWSQSKVFLVLLLSSKVDNGELLWLTGIGTQKSTDESVSDEDIDRMRPASPNVHAAHPELEPVQSNSKEVDIVPQMNGKCFHGSDHISGGNPPNTCSSPVAKSHEIYSQDSSHSNTDLKSFKLWSRDCRHSDTTDCHNARSKDSDLQTSHKTNHLNNLQPSQKLCDAVIINGIGGGAPDVDVEPENIPPDDDDGVVFNTADFEVLCTIKADRERSSRLLEFGESVNCSDILQWDLDSPHKAQMIDDKYADGEAENLAVPGHNTLYTDENRRISMEPNNGVLFSSECSDVSRISDTVSRRLDLTQRPSSNNQARVFSDISDDDDVGGDDGELIPTCSRDVEVSRLLLEQDKIQIGGPSITVHPAAADEVMNILSKREMEIETANWNGNAMEYDYSYEDFVRQNSGNKLPHRNSDQSSSPDAIGETGCRNGASTMNSLMDNETRSASPKNSDGATKLPASNFDVMYSSTEVPSRASATALTKRIRQRRRNKCGNRTILDVMNMLLKTSGASDYGRQQTDEPGTDAEESENQDEENADGESLATLSSELATLFEDEPGSPMDEAPPLLAITDLLEDGTNGTGPTHTETRAAVAGVAYDSDDTEVAMPVIEDMRPLLPKEDAAENEVCRNHEEEQSKAKKVRKASMPQKRAVSVTGKDELEIERTQSLSIVCDHCTFACGCERVLHQHVKVCHRIAPRSNNKQARYVCKNCPATAEDKESFFDHVVHHPGQHLIRYYECSRCGVDTADMETMEEHVSSSHDEAVLRFEVVQERITYLANLMNCPLCGAASRWKKNFVGHIRNYHQMEQLAAYLELVYRDQQCPDKLCIRRSDVMGQAGISGGMEAGNQCEVSNAANSISRYRMLSETSSSFNSSLSVVVHICCRCTFSTDDINSYLEHYKGHFSMAAPASAPRATTITQSADQVPRTDERLLEQPKAKTGGPYACHLCPFKTPKRMFYHRHMAIHERNNGMTDGYRCGYCQFAHPRVQCIKFHLGKYHGNRPTKVVRISGGIESEIFEDGRDNNDEEEPRSYPTSRSFTSARNDSPHISSYDSYDSLSSLSSTTTASKSAFPVNQKTRALATDRLKRLNEFERRLPPSMFYEEPVKCPLCNFSNTVRINLIRHLRTHRNDDQEEIGNDVADNVSGFADAESWQSGTSEAGGYTQAAAEATSTSEHNTSIKSIATKQRMTQQLIKNCVVSISFSIVYTMPKH